MAITDALVTIPVDQLHPHPDNPRLDLDDRDGLTASIKQLGILEPLIVTPDPEGGYTILAGHRRHASAIDAGLTDVDCVVREGIDPLAQVTGMVHENHHRDGLTPAEMGRGVQQMFALGSKVTHVAKGLGVSQAKVKDFVKANDLAAPTKDAVHAGTITLDAALMLAEFENDPDLYDAGLAELLKGQNASWVRDRLVNAATAKARQAEFTAYVDAHQVPITDVDSYGRNVDVFYDEDAIAAHIGLDCHAVKYDPYGTNPVKHLCINARAHRKDADGKDVTSNEAVETAKEAERKARRRVIANNKAFDVANAARNEWLEQFLTRKTMPKGALAPTVALLTARVPEHSDYAAARSALGAGHDLASISEAMPNDQTATKALVLTLVHNVEHVNGLREVWRRSSETFAAYLTLLSQWGYVLTPPEALYVERVTANKSTSDVDYPTTTPDA
ncbi:ParB/RepB/Spo0J family partition protein [Demequina sp.]|uniref:ParB/RepB/Spo0J family partition protein n=1 Tax=Demequina sp. TaxID=2050685 RepID=UPI003D11B4D9